MPEQGSITVWLTELRNGRSTAATQLWNRYYERLVRLAAQKLSGAPRRVADEEDVVLEAFHSFCRGARQGRFPRLDDRDDLWQVLVMLTARKAINQRKHDMRQRRNPDPTGEATQNLDFAMDEVIGVEPTPEFACEVAEECSLLLERLDDKTLQAVATAKMEGYTNDEIASQLGVKTRTIERKLHMIRELWSAQGQN